VHSIPIETETRASHTLPIPYRANELHAHCVNESHAAQDSVKVSSKPNQLHVLPTWTRHARPESFQDNTKFKHCPGQKRGASTSEVLPELPNKQLQVFQVEDDNYLDMVEASSQPRQEQ